MLPAPDGQPMLTMAVSGFEFDLEQLVVVILREHEQKYDARRGINDAFGGDVEIVIARRADVQPGRDGRQGAPDPTPRRAVPGEGQRQPLRPARPRTGRLLRQRRLAQQPRPHQPPQQELRAGRPQRAHHEHPREGGHLRSVQRRGLLLHRTRAVPGRVRPHVGDATPAWDRELFISDIIATMVLEGTPVLTRRVERYQDWGTVHEWHRTLLASRTVFAALDGFVFERGSAHFSPRFSDVTATQGGGRRAATDQRPRPLRDPAVDPTADARRPDEGATRPCRPR